MTAMTKSAQKNSRKSAQNVARIELMSRLQEVRRSWTNGECNARKEIALTMQNQLLHRLAKNAPWVR